MAYELTDEDLEQVEYEVEAEEGVQPYKKKSNVLQDFKEKAVDTAENLKRARDEWEAKQEAKKLEAIEKNTAKLNREIAKKQKEAELMREYDTRSKSNVLLENELRGYETSRKVAQKQQFDNRVRSIREPLEKLGNMFGGGEQRPQRQNPLLGGSSNSQNPLLGGNVNTNVLLGGSRPNSMLLDNTPSGSFLFGGNSPSRATKRARTPSTPSFLLGPKPTLSWLSNARKKSVKLVRRKKKKRGR